MTLKIISEIGAKKAKEALEAMEKKPNVKITPSRAIMRRLSTMKPFLHSRLDDELRLELFLAATNSRL